MSVESEISRARKRPMDPTKMRELLTKLRKGATSTLTFGKLLQVLEHLDWEIVAMLGWTPRHYPYEDKEHFPSVSTVQMSRDALDARHVELKRVERDEELPDYPSEIGEVVVMDVGDIIKGAEYGDSHIYFFHWREWVATEGLGLTSPSGVAAEFLPDHHDLDRGSRSLSEGGSMAVSEVWRWLKKEGGIEDSINQALGTEKHVPAAERTRENTGTCPACWGNFKLSEGRLVMHGYERPGYGFLKGSCFCARRKSMPLETSDEGAREYKLYLKGQLKGETVLLSRLKSGDVELVQGYGGRVVKRGESAFERLLVSNINKVEHTIKQIKADVELYSKVLDAWVSRPMPKQGELQRQPRFFLPK
jgi:hypothetical protein